MKEAFITVAYPPTDKTATILDQTDIDDGYGGAYYRIDTAKVAAVVKVVKVDMSVLNTGIHGIDYFLSDEIDEPGINPLFLIHAVSGSLLASNYLTDGKRLWHVVWHTVSYFPPGIPLINNFSYKVTSQDNFSWQMTRKDIEIIQKTIKRFAEGLE